jgi:hypothetical protein
MEWIVYKRNKQSNVRIIARRNLTQAAAITIAYQLNVSNKERGIIHGCCTLQSVSSWTDKIQEGAV